MGLPAKWRQRSYSAIGFWGPQKSPNHYYSVLGPTLAITARARDYIRDRDYIAIRGSCGLTI